jgi:hypothetical protein
VSFSNSCSSDVQADFARGVAMLHSFWYSAAEEAFRDVLAKDGSCAIADWGIAAILMNNPLGGVGASPKHVEKARAAVEEGRRIVAATQLSATTSTRLLHIIKIGPTVRSAHARRAAPKHSKLWPRGIPTMMRHRFSRPYISQARNLSLIRPTPLILRPPRSWKGNPPNTPSIQASRII